MSSHEDAPLPDWWASNQRVKEDLGLPPYVPPRFQDDVYTHEVVRPLESDYDCAIMFIGVGVRHRDDWEVRIDGESAFAIGRSRDENGNTVYHQTADEFRRNAEVELDSRGD